MEAHKPRRIVVLIDSLLGGGAERVAVELAGALDPTRFTAHLLVTRHSGPLEQLVHDRGLSYTILDRKGAIDVRALVRARSVIRGADLLHAHKFEGSLLGAVLARVARRPLIAHEHTFSGRSNTRRKLGYRFVIARTARRIVCVSGSVARSLSNEGVPAKLLSVIANGVPTAVAVPREEARAELGLESECIVIGMISRLRPEKRHELALAALALLREDGRLVKLCCVGDGPRRDELAALADELGVGEHVRWAGERSNAGRLARAFDVAVLCSDYEGMPLAALEFLVCGIPLVGTAVGSLPELVSGGGGRVVPPGDAPALARALAAELDESDPVKQERAAGRAEKLFGLGGSVARLQELYDQVLGDRDQPPRS